MKILLKVNKGTINTCAKLGDEKVLCFAATMIKMSNSTEATSVLVQLKMWFEKISGDL